MKIGVFTYNANHRKTHDLVFRLKLRRYSDITLLILPWICRTNHIPIYNHRPKNYSEITPWDFANAMNIKAKLFSEQEHDLENYDKLLIGGAGILSENLLEYNIINSHPGYLPNVRGLDALKWAILEGQPIGITTHIIGKEADTGTLIDRKIVPVYFIDSFQSVAMRQYDMEIDMLVEAVSNEPTEELKAYPEYPIHKRMNVTDELRMIKRFNKLIESL